MRRMLNLSCRTIAAVLLCAPGVRAQATTPVDIGITAGLNMSTISGGTEGTAKRSYRPDFMAGASVIFSLNDMVALQTELLYSRQGVKFTDTGFEGSIKLNYITVPVLLRFGVGDAKSEMKPAIYVGPYVAMKAGCQLEGKSGSVSSTADCSSTTADVPVKSMDFGGAVGGELSFGMLGVFARYSMGFMSIDNAKTSPEDIKNRLITIGGRWSFRAQ